MAFGIASVTALSRNRIAVVFTDGPYDAPTVHGPDKWSVALVSAALPQPVIANAFLAGDSLTVWLDIDNLVDPSLYRVTALAATGAGVPAAPAYMDLQIGAIPEEPGSARLPDDVLGWTDSPDVPPTDLYRMLQRGLRDLDLKNGEVLRRFLEGPQAIWDDLVQDFWKTLRINDPLTAPDDNLLILRELLGFGRFSGAPDRLAMSLGEADLRKLLTVAAPFWARRGLLDMMAATIMAFSHGVRPIFRDWFYLRWMILASSVQVGYGESTLYGHPWCEYNRILDVPSDQVGGDMLMNIYVPDFGGLNRQVPISILELSRPAWELWRGFFCDFLDSCVDGLSPHWESRGSDPLQWIESSRRLRFTRNLTRARASTPHCSVWTRYSWSVAIRRAYAANAVALRFYVQDDLNYYSVVLTGPAGIISLYRTVAGATVFLQGEARAPVLDSIIRIEIDDTGGMNQIRIYEDGVLILENTADNTFRSGTVEIVAPNLASYYYFEVLWTTLWQMPASGALLGRGAPIEFGSGI